MIISIYIVLCLIGLLLWIQTSRIIDLLQEIKEEKRNERNNTK